MITVAAPVTGKASGLSAVPDPVFAEGIVGPGVAIEPEEGDDICSVVAPIAGKLVKVKPHAFVVVGEDGVGVLVHLGIDTVKLDGAGFDIVTEEGADVDAGAEVIRWRPQQIRDQGLSAIVPVVAVDTAPDKVVGAPGDGTLVAAGETIFTVN